MNTMLLPLFFLLLGDLSLGFAKIHRYRFIVVEREYTRLCSSKTILTVNGMFPGPCIYVSMGDTIVVNVMNRANHNITIHWHGVEQNRDPWSDGPEYITQCAIRPGKKFQQRIVLSNEIGTLWWHAHSEWSRATVHGLLIVYPKLDNTNGAGYPFPIPNQQIPLVIGEWWKSDIQAVLDESRRTGGEPNVSDAFTINGQPGILYPCSARDVYKLNVQYGKTYLIRMVNAVMNNIMFFKIANHSIVVVGSDGAYLKPFETDYITISPGQTIDFLLKTNQPPNRYYMAARVYSSGPNVSFDHTTTTAILEYAGSYPPPAVLTIPTLPIFNDTVASTNFTGRMRSLANKDYPINVPLSITRKFIFTLSINVQPCIHHACEGPFQERFLASINNITFRQPKISILEAYYNRIKGIYDANFPSEPPLQFDYTADSVPVDLWRASNGTKVVVLEYNSTVEIVLQGTNTVGGIDHPMHLHGQSFYVVGWGFGNFDAATDPRKYNLVDPPYRNSITVPIRGWTTIRFRATNPGVWLMHCHLERHIAWGMETVFITKDGKRPNEKMVPPPKDYPSCR